MVGLSFDNRRGRPMCLPFLFLWFSQHIFGIVSTDYGFTCPCFGKFISLYCILQALLHPSFCPLVCELFSHFYAFEALASIFTNRDKLSRFHFPLLTVSALAFSNKIEGLYSQTICSQHQQ